MAFYDNDSDSGTFVYAGTLTSFGSMADGKNVKRSVFTFQGNTGSGMATISSDKYYVRRKLGRVELRDIDDSDNLLDWSSYISYQDLGNIAFRATYTVKVQAGTETTYTNETVTIAEIDSYSATGSDGTLDGELSQNLWVQEIHAEYGDIGGFLIDSTTIKSDSGNVTLDSSTPYISLGNVTSYSDSTVGHAGFWVGKDSGTYKQVIGSRNLSQYMSWDGSQLYVSGTIAGTIVAAGTDSNTWTVNQDLTDANVDLVFGRTTGGNATMRWNGTLVSIDKAFDVTGNITVTGNVDGVDVSAFNAVQFVTLATNANVANERVLTGGAGLTLSDGGAGSTVTLNVGAGNGITVNADDVALTTPGTLTVSTSNNAASNHTHAITSSSNPGAAASLLASNASGFLTLVKLSTDTLTDKSGGNLTISPTGDVIFDPTGNDILPTTNYDLNIGSLSKKYLTLHAAELWVETLVAQDTIATIGGRILVGPTTVLTADLAADGTTITVKHNEMANGDRVYLEANGSVEFMAITSAAGGSAGAYTYSVTRNLDGSGANAWYAGDAVFNTGTTGDGFIDVYSLRSVKSATQYGPTIVGNVRNSSTYNDWSEVWAVGNLNGVYGYGANTYGSAFGKFGASLTNVTMDATNGFRIRNNTTNLGQWAADGDFFIGTDVGSNGANPTTTGFAIFNTSQTFGSLSAAQGDVVFGNASGKRLFYDASSGVLDLIGNVRISDSAGANYGVNVGEALLLARYDGARPFETDFTGNAHGHRGQVPTATGGVIYRDGKFGKAVQIAEATTNLITNPSFEYDSGMTGWTTLGTWATNSRSSEQAKLGTYSNKLVNSSGSEAFRYATFTATVATSTISIWVYRSVASGSVTLYLQENFAPFGIIASTTATSTTGSWQRLIVSGATTATSSYRLILGAATGNTLYIDGGQAESKSYVTPYCDGSLGTGHSWSGTAHNSTSSRTAATLTYAYSGNIDLTQGSISYWFYMPASNTTPCYDFGLRIDGNNYLNIRHIVAGVRTPIAASASGGSAVDTNTAPTTAATNTWHHIAVTWTTGALKLYLNGVQSGATATYVVPSGTPSTIEIGSFNSTQYSNSRIDDFAILPVVLSDVEIKAIYDSNAPLVVETGVGEIRLTASGKGQVFGNADGLFGMTAAGNPAFALLTGAKNATAWGGASETLADGDAMLGSNNSGKANLLWDESVGRLNFRGGTTTQLYVDTDGSLVGGGGVSFLNSNGFIIDVTTAETEVRSYQFKTGSTSLSRLSAYTNSTVNFVGGRVDAITGKGSFIQLASNAPTSQISSVLLELSKNGAVTGKFELIDDASNNNDAFLSDVDSFDITIGAGGVIVDQGANDTHILTFLSSDVAHGITDEVATSIYGAFRKTDGASGGLDVRGFKDADGSAGNALRLRGHLGEAADTTKSTAALGVIDLDASIKSGTAIAAVGANGNLVVVRSNATCRFILDADGDSHQDVGTAWTNFDTHNDLELLNLFSAHLTRPDDPLRDNFSAWMAQSRDVLESLRLVTFNDDGHHFVNWSRMHMLEIGALRQIGEHLDTLTNQLNRLEKSIALTKHA